MIDSTMALIIIAFAGLLGFCAYNYSENRKLKATQGESVFQPLIASMEHISRCDGYALMLQKEFDLMNHRILYSMEEKPLDLEKKLPVEELPFITQEIWTQTYWRCLPLIRLASGGYYGTDDEIDGMWRNMLFEQGLEDGDIFRKGYAPKHAIQTWYAFQVFADGLLSRSEYARSNLKMIPQNVQPVPIPQVKEVS